MISDNREVLSFNDDFSGSLNPQLLYSLPYTGKYYVVVGSLQGEAIQGVGEYDLTVRHVGGLGGAGVTYSLFVSSSENGQTGFTSYRDEDILHYGTSDGRWSVYFDGSDVGLGGSNGDIDALSIISSDKYSWEDDLLLISLAMTYNVPGVGTVDDSDILLFEPTRLGSSTAGKFSLLLDGSISGFSGGFVDALHIDTFSE